MPVKRVSLAQRRANTSLLRRMRERLGLTMGEAARAHGMPVAAWCNLEIVSGMSIELDIIETLVTAAEDKSEKS